MNEQHQLNIKQLRKDVKSGLRLLRITTHAHAEAVKDGLVLADLRYTFENGDLIEEYPEECRGLLYIDVPDIEMPVHIVIEDTPIEGVIITAYIPDRRLWSRNRIRKLKK